MYICKCIYQGTFSGNSGVELEALIVYGRRSIRPTGPGNVASGSFVADTSLRISANQDASLIGRPANPRLFCMRGCRGRRSETIFLSRKQAPCLTLDRRVVALLFLDRRSFYPGYSLFSGRGTVPGASQHPDLKITPPPFPCQQPRLPVSQDPTGLRLGLTLQQGDQQTS